MFYCLAGVMAHFNPATDSVQGHFTQMEQVVSDNLQTIEPRDQDCPSVRLSLVLYVSGSAHVR